MIYDNGHIIMALLKNKDAKFVTTDEDGVRVYWAVNRAARRYIWSNTFETYAEKEGLTIDHSKNHVY